MVWVLLVCPILGSFQSSALPQILWNDLCLWFKNLQGLKLVYSLYPTSDEVDLVQTWYLTIVKLPLKHRACLLNLPSSYSSSPLLPPTSIFIFGSSWVITKLPSHIQGWLEALSPILRSWMALSWYSSALSFLIPIAWVFDTSWLHFMQEMHS